jgi:hypothetical protein
MNPNDKPPDWFHITWSERLFHAAMLLYCHGFLPEAEYEKAKRRILKWVERERDSGGKEQ